MNKQLFLICCVFLSFLTKNAIADEGNLPTGARGFRLYPMGGREVIVVKGNVPRTYHENPTGLFDRSIPEQDPSELTGYHFELKDFIIQKELITSEAIEQSIDTVSLVPGNALYSYYLTNKIKSIPQQIYQNAIAAKDHQSFQTLAIHESRYKPDGFEAENGITAVNSNYEFTGISDRKYGYCWGFATLQRRLLMLSFFDPSKQLNVRYIPNGFNKNKIWFKYYEKIIDKIANGIPAVIPGFKNIREFSAIPEIEFYLKLKAIDLWSKAAAHTTSLPFIFSTHTMMSTEDIKAFTRKLKIRSDRGELPKILFTSKNSKGLLNVFGSPIISTDIHAVLVTDVKLNPDGTGTIQLWDSNFYAENMKKEPRNISIIKFSDGSLAFDYYPTRFEHFEDTKKTAESSLLRSIRFAPEYESETGALISTLKSFCTNAATKKYCDGRH